MCELVRAHRKWLMKRTYTYTNRCGCAFAAAFVEMQMHECFIYYAASFSVHGALLQRKMEESGGMRLKYNAFTILCTI